MTEDTKVETPTAEGGAVAEAKPEAEKTVAVGGKTKAKGTGDLILDVAQKVETLTKTKALNRAEELADTVEASYLELGGVLKVIKDNTWFDGFPDFDSFVTEKYGFAARKAHYLIQIYTDLVTKQIPWTKVQHLGWTKLKDLAPHLTLENLDAWVAKAEKLTVAELQNVLKAKDVTEGGTAKTTDDLVKIKFAMKSDQAHTVQTALAKAKGELNTEFDTVALENICSSYLANGGSAIAAVDSSSVEAFCKSVPMMAILEVLAAQNPDWDITVDKAKTEAAAA